MPPHVSGPLRHRWASPGRGGGNHGATGPGPTFVLDIKLPLLPEAPERCNAGAGANQDAGHLGVPGQVEAGRSAQGGESHKPR